MKSWYLIITFFAFYHALAGSCRFHDVSLKERRSERNEIFANMRNPGVRMSWVDFKQKNLQYLQGTVDNKISQYESNICQQFDNLAQRKDVEITVTKTDFKGYYITCNPSPSCRASELIESIDRSSLPSFGADDIFQVSAAKGESYQDGYVRSRLISNYENFNPSGSVDNFLKLEMQAAIKEVLGLPDDTKLSKELISSINMTELTEKLNDYRLNQLTDSDPYHRLAVALDSMEIPFQGSNNFDSELNDATRILTQQELNRKVNSMHPAQRYFVEKAQCGDDVIYIVRDRQGNIVKVVGADARGLGVLNMTTRLERFGEVFDRIGIEDIFGISRVAIDKADDRLETTFETFEDLLTRYVNSYKIDDLDIAIANAYGDYDEFRQKNPNELMETRAGALNAAGKSNSAIKNEITTIHNILKLMEKNGINGHFGDSCIGTEFWARFLGVKKAHQMEN